MLNRIRAVVNVLQIWVRREGGDDRFQKTNFAGRGEQRALVVFVIVMEHSISDMIRENCYGKSLMQNVRRGDVVR